MITYYHITRLWLKGRLNMDYYEVFEEKYCQHCEYKKYKIDEVTHFMEEVVKQLYTKEGALNEDILDHCLSEICHCLSLKIPNQMLQVVRKNRTSTDYLSEWKSRNNIFLNTLVKKEG